MSVSAMQDSFDYDAYWQLLDRLCTTHQPVRFADVFEWPQGRCFILRHDVDYSTSAAMTLAAQEAERGVRATYFLLPSGVYYNLLDPAHADIPRRLVGLGHEVGLHYDVNLLYRLRGGPEGSRHGTVDEWMDIIHAQVALLEALSGAPVTSIAMHQPGLNGADPLRGRDEYRNAYDDRFVRDIPYISDSCRAWRDGAWQILNAGPLPDRFQLALHPINWSNHDRSRTQIFSTVHRDLTTAINEAGRVLLDQIERHPAVIEHEERSSSILQGGRQ